MHTLTQWDINYFNPVVLQVVSFFYFADKKETRLSSENQNKAVNFNRYDFAFVCALFNLKISEQVICKSQSYHCRTLPYLSVYPIKGFTLPCIESSLTGMVSPAFHNLQGLCTSGDFFIFPLSPLYLFAKRTNRRSPIHSSSCDAD